MKPFNFDEAQKEKEKQQILLTEQQQKIIDEIMDKEAAPLIAGDDEISQLARNQKIVNAAATMGASPENVAAACLALRVDVESEATTEDVILGILQTAVEEMRKDSYQPDENMQRIDNLMAQRENDLFKPGAQYTMRGCIFLVVRVTGALMLLEFIEHTERAVNKGKLESIFSPNDLLLLRQCRFRVERIAHPRLLLQFIGVSGKLQKRLKKAAKAKQPKKGFR